MLDMALARVLPSGASELLLVRSPAVDDDDAAASHSKTRPRPSRRQSLGTGLAPPSRHRLSSPAAGSRQQAAARNARSLARSLGDQGYTVGLSG